MAIKKQFFVHDFPEVLKGMQTQFSSGDFYNAVMATMPAKGPGGEDTTKVRFKKTVKTAISNWLGRKLKAGELTKSAPRKGWRVGYVRPAPAKKDPVPPEAPHTGLSVLDIGMGIEALINTLRERKDHWKKAYHDKLREFEDLTTAMRELKVDKENLNRRLDKQNTEIMRLTNEAKVAPSKVSLSEVVRYRNQKTKTRGGKLL